MFCIMQQYGQWFLQDMEHTMFECSFSDSFTYELFDKKEGNIVTRILEGLY